MGQEGQGTQEAATADEVATLRRRVANLEAERAELLARTNAAVAAAEERTYWLDRWDLDLNSLMRRRGAERLRVLLREARLVWRRLARMRARGR